VECIVLLLMSDQYGGVKCIVLLLMIDPGMVEWNVLCCCS